MFVLQNVLEIMHNQQVVSNAVHHALIICKVLIDIVYQQEILVLETILIM